MKYAADLHLHSRWARACSKDLNFENLAKWAKIKGIDLLVSADFTHPSWFQETRLKLQEAGDGLYEFDGVAFVLGTEVSCNSHEGGRDRRIHMLIFAPSLDTVERINAALAARGDLEYDGRPSLQMSPRELVSTLLEIDERCLVIPAHAWTPWFGILGSVSGFDSLAECFGDLMSHIYGVETGLSSDPAMNWRIPELDNLSLVSFSDAHSLQKMGRELTIFDGELSYQGLADCLKEQRIAYTIEFFPEEGKYHYSGHRNCGVKLSPEEVAINGPRCPVCRRRLTLGVMQRVAELATREVSTRTDDEGLVHYGGTGHGVQGTGLAQYPEPRTPYPVPRPPYKMLVGLHQIIAESLGYRPAAKKVQAEYFRLVSELDSELSVLMNSPLEDIARVSSERVAEAIARVRKSDIAIEPGYDGVYGIVKVWPESPAEAAAQARMELE
jgi:uncharacterized protein (TIGR00375 family)